jgi:AraC-like DNA-binding protein
MRLARTTTVTGVAPLWPPTLASLGPGAESAPHAHHAMHMVLALAGELRVRGSGQEGRSAPGVLTAPDVPHRIDARGVTVLLVFIDPESDAGAALRATLNAPIRAITDPERARLAAEALDPIGIMSQEGVGWTRRLVDVLGGASPAVRRIHPRVRRVVRHLHALPPDGDASLEAVAAVAGLSTGRLMHAFTESIGIPLRPYVAWLRLQRAAAAIVAGEPLGRAAALAGFADSAHMARAFRTMFGMRPSALRPR